VLSALGVAAIGAAEVTMRLGREEIALVEFDSPGREVPADSRSDDLWFQHLAIVVSDMQAAYAHLCSTIAWRPISSEGPQTLPPSNGAVQAFKFRDPDGHPLELLWFPPGGGRSVWHQQRRDTGSLPFLGIDHSALAVSSTRSSVAFYGSLGLRTTATSLNSGPAQSRLDGLPAARVKVTALRAASPDGPGLELLAYRPPGRRAQEVSVTDRSSDWVTLAAAPGRGADAAPRALTDPDGHRILITEPRPARSAGPLLGR
jgi:catechol 2,3-dioxygenase-like lactoylglutathione lyase family enzyme